MTTRIFDFLGEHLARLKAGDDRRHVVAKYLQDLFVKCQGLFNIGASLEIGAHEASYSQDIKKILPPDVPVVAFEASPATYAHFAKKTEFSEMGIAYLNLALSDSKKTIEFYEYFSDNKPDGEIASQFSSMYERNEGCLHDTPNKVKVEVPAVPGDEYLGGHLADKENIALWIDVEGAQAEVLEGLKKSFEAGKIASVYIEVEIVPLWPGQKMLGGDVVDFMDKHGFIACLRDNEWLAQFNIVFLRKDLFDKHRKAIQGFSVQYLEDINKLLGIDKKP